MAYQIVQPTPGYSVEAVKSFCSSARTAMLGAGFVEVDPELHLDVDSIDFEIETSALLVGDMVFRTDDGNGHFYLQLFFRYLRYSTSSSVRALPYLDVRGGFNYDGQDVVPPYAQPPTISSFNFANNSPPTPYSIVAFHGDGYGGVIMTSALSIPTPAVTALGDSGLLVFERARDSEGAFIPNEMSVFRRVDTVKMVTSFQNAYSRTNTSSSNDGYDPYTTREGNHLYTHNLTPTMATDPMLSAGGFLGPLEQVGSRDGLIMAQPVYVGYPTIKVAHAVVGIPSAILPNLSTFTASPDGVNDMEYLLIRNLGSTNEPHRIMFLTGENKANFSFAFRVG